MRKGGNMEPQGVNQRMFDMLETMREEQENLNRELAAKEEEKARFLDFNTMILVWKLCEHTHNDKQRPIL